jgi:hypothetical protein
MEGNNIFIINDKKIEISKEMDIFNQYRLIFRRIAEQQTEEVEIQYNNSVHNIDDFLSRFPNIYKTNLEPIIETAVDILIGEEIWTVTKESLTEQHLTDFHLAIDDYRTMVESFNLTIEENQKRKAKAWGYVPNMIGGGFGLIGAIKGMAKATAYNIIRDSIEDSSLKNADVTQPQREELYNRINKQLLFDRIYCDYWRVFLSMIYIMNQNNKNIWWPEESKTRQAQNIFINLSNPNFPKDKRLDALIQIITTNPYNINYYIYLEEKFGKTDEIIKLEEYFGYTDFNNPRIS